VKLKQLNEWWAQDVAKSMKKKGTVGAFTQQCEDMGFRKTSYDCIKTAIEKADKIINNPKASKKDHDEAVLLKKRATLAKTFKKWGKNKKLNKEKNK